MVCSKYGRGPHAEQDKKTLKSIAMLFTNELCWFVWKRIYKHIAKEVKHKHKGPKCHRQSSNWHPYLNLQS